ncbi:MAG: sugar phosphate isomerase/epimerase [Flavisolibacter sp.]
MVTRRSFIQSSSIVAAGLMISPSRMVNRSNRTIGLQLYTVRDDMQKDPSGTLARVAQIGYNSVEGATYTGSELFYGMKPAEFSRLLHQNGLVMPSSHYRLGEEKVKGELQKGTLMNDWKKAVDDAASLGVKYMVCAYLSDAERKGLDHYKFIAQQFNQAAEVCKKAGIQFCYHNHDFEFIKQENKYPYDILLEKTDKNLVKMEMDIYWMTKAQQDPIALFNHHPGRFPLWHVKDMDRTPKKMFTEVGNGVIDFKKIFKHAHQAGLKYFFVEQDICPASPFDSITQSYNYIKKNLVS